MSGSLDAMVRARQAAVATARTTLAEVESELDGVREQVDIATRAVKTERQALQALTDRPVESMAARVVRRASVEAARVALAHEAARLARLESRLSSVVDECDRCARALERAVIDLEAAKVRRERQERDRRARAERREEEATDDATLRRWSSKK